MILTKIFSLFFNKEKSSSNIITGIKIGNHEFNWESNEKSIRSLLGRPE
jgi:hypothetical protein